MRTIGYEFAKLWKKYNPADNEHGKRLLNIILENQKSVQKLLLRSIYINVVLVCIFYFLHFHVIESITIFSIVIQKVALIQWALCPIICYFFYLTLSSLIQDIVYHYIVNNYIKLYMPEVNKKGFSTLVLTPNLISFELFFSHKYDSKIAGFSMMLLNLILTLIPFWIIGDIIYIDYTLWESVDNEGIKFIVFLITSILIIRSIFLLGFIMFTTEKFDNIFYKEEFSNKLKKLKDTILKLKEDNINLYMVTSKNEFLLPMTIVELLELNEEQIFLCINKDGEKWIENKKFIIPYSISNSDIEIGEIIIKNIFFWKQKYKAKHILKNDKPHLLNKSEILQLEDDIKKLNAYMED